MPVIEINGLKFIKNEDAPETYRVYHKKGLNVAIVELCFGVLTCTSLREYGSVVGDVLYQKSIADLWTDCFTYDEFREKYLTILSFVINDYIFHKLALAA